MTYLMQYHSPVGILTLSSDGTSITGVWIEGQKHFSSTVNGASVFDSSIPVLHVAGAWFDRYFSGENPELSGLPLAPAGTPFQKKVWCILQQIPYGTTITYGQIAAMFSSNGHKMAAQAVGNAVGRNPISILIPCHRVIGANGKLVGYAGGA